MALLTLAHGTAHAASQVITLTPTSSSPLIKPGTVEHGSFRVIDQGSSSYRFIVYAAPYHIDGEDYTPDFSALPTAPNITSWFNFSAPGGNAAPGQSITISYTITVPENVQPGGYYAAVFAETQYPKAANGITLNERVGELFYIQVAGPVVKKGSLATWQSSFLQKPPLTSVLRLQNQGSIHFPAIIQLEVKDLLGHDKYRLYTQKELLPQTVRRVTMPWNKTPAIGLFKVGGTASFLGHTQKLPTKWVLVMSDTVREILLAAVVIIVLAFAGRQLFVSRRRKKAKHKRE